MNFIRRLSQNPLIKVLSSVKITVVCLFLLFVLTFWGTVAQVEQGLYAAQERFFASLVFWVFKFIPFPGAQLVLWVLAVNLVCVTITRFVHYFKWKYAGILITHFGLILYFLSAFIIFQVSLESNIHLKEREGTNVSSSYFEWELACWKSDGNKRQVHAFDVTNARTGESFGFSNGGFKAVVKQFYPNAHAYSLNDKEKAEALPLNASGIALLEPQPKFPEREKNVAGGIFEIQRPGEEPLDVLLYGADTKPVPVKVGEKEYFLALQHKKYPLPLMVELVDFRAQFHPGTETAKSYESTVRITHGGATREVVISMNNPLTYRDYTFFQASYAIDSFGNEYSTFAVVKNIGRFMPYVSSLLTFGGLALHFLMMAFASRSKKGGAR